MRKGHARTPAGATARLGREAVQSAERRLLQSLDATLADAATRAGDWLVCAPGCADCCHQPFPVTRLDAARLRRGLAQLRDVDPARADAIEQRARETAERLVADFPGDVGGGRVTQDEVVLDAFLARHAGLACPVLDPASQTCELYEHRPIPCRTFGPPLRFGAENAPHCKLCFRGASGDAVEQCRVEPDPAGLERTILRALGVPGDESWETLIAFAVVDA